MSDQNLLSERVGEVENSQVFEAGVLKLLINQQNNLEKACVKIEKVSEALTATQKTLAKQDKRINALENENKLLNLKLARLLEERKSNIINFSSEEEEVKVIRSDLREDSSNTISNEIKFTLSQNFSKVSRLIGLLY